MFLYRALNYQKSKAWTPLCQKTKQKRKTESENLHTSGFIFFCPAEYRVQNA